MLEGGPYRGYIISVVDPGDEIRIRMFESGIAASYRRVGEIAEMARFHVASYNFVDLVESADSLCLRSPTGIAAVAGEYDPAFLVLTKEERRRRKHGKRTAFEEEEDQGR
jgi:hypothetical protein